MNNETEDQILLELIEILINLEMVDQGIELLKMVKSRGSSYQAKKNRISDRKIDHTEGKAKGNDSSVEFFL